jgi:hypothetical protein
MAGFLQEGSEGLGDMSEMGNKRSLVAKDTESAADLFDSG